MPDTRCPRCGELCDPTLPSTGDETSLCPRCLGVSTGPRETRRADPAEPTDKHSSDADGSSAPVGEPVVDVSGVEEKRSRLLIDDHGRRTRIIHFVAKVGFFITLLVALRVAMPAV